MPTKLASLGIALIPALARSETPRTEGDGATAALILVAGVAMILATVWLIFKVVRRWPNRSTPSVTKDTVTTTEPDAATTG